MNFQIETVSFCDLTCKECPNWQMKRQRQFMDMDVWNTILHRYVLPYKHLGNPDCPPTVIPHKDGEPLLNKKLPEFLHSVSQADASLKIDIYSHGLLLPKWRERGQDFVHFLGSLRNRVRLLLSFHFANHDGTENDYTATTAYLRDLYASGRQPRNVEFIMVSHLVQPMTRERLEAWRSSWQPFIDAGRVTVHANVCINPWTGRIEEPGTVEFHGCPYGDFGHMFFGATGNVIACCMDLEEEIVFGNVMKDEPDAMIRTLNGFYAEQRRIAAEKTGLVHEVCRNCMGMGKRNDLVQIGGMSG